MKKIKHTNGIGKLLPLVVTFFFLHSVSAFSQEKEKTLYERLG